MLGKYGYSLCKVLDCTEGRVSLTIDGSREVVGSRGERVDLDAVELGSVVVVEKLIDDLTVGEWGWSTASAAAERREKREEERPCQYTSLAVCKNDDALVAWVLDGALHIGVAIADVRGQPTQIALHQTFEQVADQAEALVVDSYYVCIE